MSEYRSALRAARERVQQLEASMPVRPTVHPKRVTISGVAALLAITLPAIGALTLLATAVQAAWPRATEIVRSPSPVVTPAPPLPPPEGLEWLAQTRFAPALAGPVVTEPDANGARAIVGLAWDRARDVDGMYVVAFDLATLEPRWRAGPYPSFRVRDGEATQHLALVGSRLVVTDVRGGVHVLDPQTGQERVLKKLANAPVTACVAGSGAAARLILPLDAGWRARRPQDPSGDSLFPWEMNRMTLAFDPATGRTTSAAPFTVCEPDHYCMWKHADGCRDLESLREGTPPTRDLRDVPPERKLEVNVHEVWSSGTDRVSLGWLGKGGRRSPPAALGWDATTHAVRWDARLSAPEHPPATDPTTRAALSARGFFFLYDTAEGPSRLVGLDPKSGERRFDVEVPGSALGTRVHDLNAKADDAFVSMNEELYVFDGLTGRLRGRLGAAR
jgi:outer membrane protein assembly factor BamB